jgi:hypothetical protein
MSWGDAFSAELDDRGRGKLPTISDSKAFSKIGQSKAADCEERLIKKAPVVLDMGEASREQGFRLNGCR